MDSEIPLNEKHGKKAGRHRKKQLYSSILQQMEFYFSTSNLSKDRFLSQLITEDEYVDLTVFLSFNKIKKLTENIEDLKKALSKSDVVELSDDKSKVRRKIPLKVKENVDDCTVYVENIKADADHDWVTSIFSEFGKVVYVSIPKYKESRSNKGFAFVEFENETDARSALDFFESIGCRMPLQTNPEELKSIATFEGETGLNSTEVESNVKKRKLSEDHADKDDHVDKKQKNNDEKQKSNEESENEIASENDNQKRKKLKKEHKKKNSIKEIGLQVLSKKEWKKMRNKYLDLQKKKMKEFKQHLLRMRFSQKFANSEKAKKLDDVESVKFEYKPGVIVRLKLDQPCEDAKKLKSELKTSVPDVQYVDIPGAVVEEVFLRFGSEKGAEEFCKSADTREKCVLKDEEESRYWEKINNDRNVKFAKSVRKQRGRDKLLKKAKEVAHHIRFDDNE